jgi:hypothetical protein
VDLGDDVPPEADPKFYFTVHSAWCQYKESGLAAVELRRPELSGLKWTDKDGKDTDKGLVGEALKLCVSCNGDTEEGAWVIFRVYREGADPRWDPAVYEAGAENCGGKAEVEWTYKYKHDPENPLTEKPKFFFIAVSKRCKEVKSGNVKMGMNYRIGIRDEKDNLIINRDCTIALSDGSKENVKSSTEGYVELAGKVPGYVLWLEYARENGNIEQLDEKK